jgi:pimeloyl-ACP methyl ester carboxylesterase
MFVDNSPAILAEFRGPWLERTAADLAQVDVPTLLVAGEESPPAFRRVTERMAAAIPNSRTVLVGGGHLDRLQGSDAARRSRRALPRAGICFLGLDEATIDPGLP